jgi:hypothetical protein
MLPILNIDSLLEKAKNLSKLKPGDEYWIIDEGDLLKFDRIKSIEITQETPEKMLLVNISPGSHTWCIIEGEELSNQFIILLDEFCIVACGCNLFVTKEDAKNYLKQKAIASQIIKLQELDNL